MPAPTLTLAAVAALAAGAPAAPVHTGSKPPPLVAASLLPASAAGHASLEGQVRAHRQTAAAARQRKQRRESAISRAQGASNPVLKRIAECESHGNPRSIGGGGVYRGAYQFTTQSWSSVGGRGDPAGAPMAEQTRRAALLLARSGSSPWPACSR